MKDTKLRRNKQINHSQCLDELQLAQCMQAGQIWKNSSYQNKSSQVKLSFIVIPLHVGTYSGTKCRASQDHGAT